MTFFCREDQDKFEFPSKFQAIMMNHSGNEQSLETEQITEF
ncbi:hypothetical protein [Rubripirellula obstinata]|nr:hypothetical protein [Rubripirellula obstinata]